MPRLYFQLPGKSSDGFGKATNGSKRPPDQSTTSFMKSLLDQQIAEFDDSVTDMEKKITYAVELLKYCKKHRDQLHMEHNNVLKEAKELRPCQAKASSSTLQPQSLQTSSSLETEELIRKFDSSLKFGEGTSGSIYNEFAVLLEQKSSLERRIAESDRTEKELEQKIISALDLSQNYKKERDELQMERDNALKESKELEQKIISSMDLLQCLKKERDKLQLERDHAVKESKELEQKITSTLELSQFYKKERDELQMERDIALKESEELRRSQAITLLSKYQSQSLSWFSFSEIEEATRQFDPSMKLGEGGYGSVFKGVLCNRTVAIKLRNSYSMQGQSEFQQEVDVLSKMRHPNLVSLVGVCPEAGTLVYEYLPNGTLEDRLSCRDNSPPLSWQSRIQIATELCSVLIFLHSRKEFSIVHGDVKPSNILLDVNLVSKLSDFGISRLVYCPEGSSDNILYQTVPKGTFAYMDPEYLATGELTPKSDSYSFGIILLRLLTGRPALGIAKEARYALDRGDLKALLDPLAGDWPFVIAEQLAFLGLRCCKMNRKSRPDLASEVLPVLEPMKASCDGSITFRLSSEKHGQPPSYFVCPIFQEVMQDPHVAADGFTYEAEAIKGWLDQGHDTSPMTNLKLAHSNLVPNHALRLAIQEWLRQHGVGSSGYGC